jgi:hypothetical protein
MQLAQQTEHAMAGTGEVAPGPQIGDQVSLSPQRIDGLRLTERTLVEVCLDESATDRRHGRQSS